MRSMSQKNDLEDIFQVVKTHFNNSTLQVVVNIDLGDDRCLDIGQVEVACLFAETRPARRSLSFNRHDRRFSTVLSTS